MENRWTHKDFVIRDALKPESKHFQYFFVVSEGEKKKCRYCVWIDDDVLSRFDPSRNFEAIVSANREEWRRWVKEKLEKEDFRNVVLKFEEEGQKEFDLARMEEKVSMEG